MSETRYPSMIIMGVQGSGKSTIGQALAERLPTPVVLATIREAGERVSPHHTFSNTYKI